MKLSLKKKFAAAFAAMAAFVFLICILSVYTYEVLVGNMENISRSLAELNEFRFHFSEFNANLEEYFESGSSECIDRYGSLKSELTALGAQIDKRYSESADKVETSLADSIVSTFSKYILQTDELMITVDREQAEALYREKYSLNAGYISGYVDKLIATRYKASGSERENVRTKIFTFKIILGVVLTAFVFLIVGMAIVIFRKLIEPLEILSRQTKQISGFNFDMEINVPKTGDEIEELSENFRDMKDSLKNSFETNQKNIQILDDMLIQFEGNDELREYIHRQREISDDIFRQANIDKVSGLMNGKAFERCMNYDVKSLPEDSTCAVCVTEIVNYDEIARYVYEGIDELVRSTVKKLSYITGEHGYTSRWEKDRFIIFIPDVSRFGDMDAFSRDIKNALDYDFVYRKVRQHVDVRVNTLVSHSPNSEKLLINYAVNGIEDIEPGEYRVVQNNIL